LLGLNSFTLNEYVINILPDYEALGATLANAVKEFGAKHVTFLTPSETNTPATAQIIIGAAKRKIDAAVRQSKSFDLEQEVSQDSPFDKAAFIYMRRRGVDKQGYNVNDLDTPIAEKLLLDSGGDRLLFVALGNDGFTVRTIDPARSLFRERKEGADKGLAYWNLPVQAIMLKFADRGGNPRTPSAKASIKTLNTESHPAIIELLKAKQPVARRSPINVCVF
jgi:hypothetical protein